MVKRSTSSRADTQVMRERTPAPPPATTRALRMRAAAPRQKPAAPQGPLLVAPGLTQATVLDLMCSRLALALVTRTGARFNLRRDLGTLLELAGRHFVWPVTVLRRLRTFLEHRCQGNEWWEGQAGLSPSAFLARFGQWQGPYEEGTLFFHLDDYAKEAPKDILAVLAATSDWLSGTLEAQQSRVERNIDTLGDLLQLNRAERALLLFGTLTRYQRELRNLLVELKVHNALEAHAALGEVAGVPPNDVAEALRTGSRLERIGLVDNLMSEHNITDMADLMKVSERLPPVLMREYRHRHELMAVFTRPAASTALTVGDFDFVREDAQLLCDLLRSAVERREAGVNVLIYGPPGTGKTELARVTAQAAGLELFEVEYADRDGHSLAGRDRYRSLQIAQVFLKGTARSALLFDEVEDVFPALPTEGRGRHEPLGSAVGGKAWVNQVLENNPVPTLWITNRIEQIDPAFRRRFAYHLELKSPPPGAREQLVRKALAGAPVSEALVSRLSERPGLTPAQIHTALRFANLVMPEHRDAEGSLTPRYENLIERQLAHADQALGQRLGHAARPNLLPYGLEWLNTESRHDLPRILDALRARGHGTLCFFGPPGTGKTALAEHMAQALQRPLMVRQASDLMSKFVGETEQQMAAMFSEAEAEQAVLLLDEADSFLLDRRGAQRSHEVSEVNEMLQGMERFRGIFVCTTNLLDRLDAAALRRFTFKVQFKALRPEQRLALFAQEALGLCATDDLSGALDATWVRRLQKLDQLTMGDFAAIRRQCEILQDQPAPEAFLEQLEAEHRLKPEVREGRNMGFVH